MLTTTPHLYIRRPSPTTAEFTVTTCPPLTLPLRLLLLALNLIRVLVAAAAILSLHVRFLLLGPQSPSAQQIPPSIWNRGANNEGGDGEGEGLLALLWSGSVTTFLSAVLHAAHGSRPGVFLHNLTAALPDWAVAGISLAALYLALFVQLHTTESVLVLRGLGIQTCSGSGSGSYSSPGLGLGLGSRIGRGLGCWVGWLFGSGAGGSGGAGGGGKTRFIPTEKIRDVLINEAFRGFEVRYYLIVVVEGEEDVVVLFPGLLPRRKIVEAVWRGIRGCLFEGGEGDGGAGKGER